MFGELTKYDAYLLVKEFNYTLFPLSLFLLLGLF